MSDDPCHQRHTDNPGELREAARIVPTGVGNFADGMKHLRECGFEEVIHEQVKARGDGQMLASLCERRPAVLASARGQIGEILEGYGR